MHRGVPATGFGGRSGYVDRGGEWIDVAEAVDTSRFEGGVAVVGLAEDRYTFLDARLHRVGGEWAEIERVYASVIGAGRVVGYVVTGPAGKGLLGPDLRTIVEPGGAEIRCDREEADGACSVRAVDGTATLLGLPEGTVAPMSDGFTQALSRSFIADQVAADDFASSRVLALASGQVSELVGPSSCRAAGAAWVVCTPDSEVLPPVVIDARGRRTGYRSIEPVAGAVRGGGVAYYWVTSGRYEGFVDDQGTWRYRQGRFTQLED